MLMIVYRLLIYIQSFNDSGSEAGLSDSMGYDATKRYSLDSSGRVSSPEQQVFIVAAPSRQVNFEDMEVCTTTCSYM